MRRGMTYEDLCYGTLVLSGVLMKEALIAYDKESGLRCAVHRTSDFPTFRNAPEEVLQVVRERLSKQEYVHYFD